MIEIKEMLVRTIVVDNGNSSNEKDKKNMGEFNHKPLNEEEYQVLVDDCIRQVLAILERQKDR
jgi:hypothetical protein